MLLGACKAPASSVEIIVATDADPRRRFELRACAVRAGGTLDRAQCTTSWAHGGPAETASFFASFGVRPRSDWNGTDPIDLVLDARIEATPEAPAVAFSRRLRFLFQRGQSSTQRVYLPVRCGAPSDSCTNMHDTPCTVALACEDRGLTCGDDAQCVALDVAPALRDAGTDTLPPRSDVVISSPDVMASMDSGDASSMADASDGIGSMDASDVVSTDSRASPPPVQWWPRAGVVVRARRPTFRWSNGDSEPAFIRVCTDRACSAGTLSAVAQVDQWTPNVDLPARPARLYWQVAPMVGDTPDLGRASPLRQLWVSSTNSAEPPVLDLNDDGVVDLAVGGRQPGMIPALDVGKISVFAGGSGAIGGSTPVTFAGVARSGFATAFALGDFTGDGVVDIVATAPNASGGTGALAVINGGPGSVNTSLSLGIAGTTRFGDSVATIGDVDRDGTDDALVGGAEAAAIVYGRPMGAGVARASTVISAPIGATGFGAATAACDVDGDSALELVIGAPSTATMSGAGSGRVIVFRLGTSGTTAIQSLDGAMPAGAFGSALGCGDFNGDGRDDLVVGAPNADGGRGEFLVFLSTMTTGLRFAVRLTAVNVDSLGSAIAAGRDINGDGFSDIAVGSPRATIGAMVNAGRATIVFGGAMLASGMATSTSLAFGVAGEMLGSSVTMLSDVSRDGVAELVAGAPENAGAGMSAGRVVIVNGRATWPVPVASASAQIAGLQARAMLGIELPR